ncbi:hypothetical protein COCC4DRAFT_67168 [Bipolaris maydis ATCC 48331]|uniref:Uncharacterized protein n=1 Tax=Cochliobolus heterostrophus (strain C4 / ATCC 48331 / race T) TaxID=665024 RepID=N4X0B1_COCH4|nr:uncharacterized protein COCC4DRAFT_67168 [Bipolaris maydis ATCC 48331]ENH98666.1 hypothetical protein COCC4DRAFT_67168 [Bipolaris maydis ATCC 48331]
MPPLQNLEESSKEEDEDIPTSSTQSTKKPYKDYDAGHRSLPTLAVTATPDPDNYIEYYHSSTPTLETQLSTRILRKRKRRDLIEQLVDTNAAANRELINSNLRRSHILLEGVVRSRKPTRKSSSFFDRVLYYNASISTNTAHIKDYQELDFYSTIDALYADHKATRKSL